MRLVDLIFCFKQHSVIGINTSLIWVMNIVTISTLLCRMLATVAEIYRFENEPSFCFRSLPCPPNRDAPRFCHAIKLVSSDL
jgi:hypothetical protein